MATATRTETVTVTLSMSDAEARTLRTVLAMVGGSAMTTPRVYVDSILDGLRDAGYGDLPDHVLDNNPFQWHEGRSLIFREGALV